MPRTCTICTHLDRAAIDRALVANEPNRRVATQFGVTESALRRHQLAGHVVQELAKAKDAADVVHADDLLCEVRALRGKAYSLLTKAEAAGDYRTALAGIREARGCLELLAKLLGELGDRPQVNLVITPQFQQAQMVILNALEGYPAARIAVADALMALEPAS